MRVLFQCGQLIGLVLVLGVCLGGEFLLCDTFGAERLGLLRAFRSICLQRLLPGTDVSFHLLQGGQIRQQLLHTLEAVTLKVGGVHQCPGDACHVFIAEQHAQVGAAPQRIGGAQ